MMSLIATGMPAQRKIDIRLLGLLGRSVHVEREISADFSINSFDAGSQRIDDFARGNFPAMATSIAERRCLAPADPSPSFYDFRDDKEIVGLAGRIAQRLLSRN